MIAKEFDKLFRGENRELVAKFLEIVEDMRPYWPLTLRQIHYRAVALRVIANTKAEYKKASRNLTALRRHDLLPWRAMVDRVRTTHDARGWPSVAEFTRFAMGDFLDPETYARDLSQEQPVYAECATEKDAVSAILSTAVWPYSTCLNVVRGHVSASMTEQIGERYRRAQEQGQRLILLYTGDLDPSGMQIPRALVRNLADFHDVEVELRRVALNPQQVAEYDLPVSLEVEREDKGPDSNYPAWLKEFGPDQPQVELDALHPKDLKALIVGALEDTYDMDVMQSQKAIELEERALLGTRRMDVMDLLGERWPDLFAA